MAASSPRKRLQDEVTCCICLEFFAQPVTLDCGHNFCRACIETCWGDASADAPETAACPQCREKVERRSLKPNRQLANFVEIAKELTVQPRPADGRWKVCELHEEPLKLFCRDDKAPICVVCDRSKEHREHNVVPVQEAAQEHRDWICWCLEKLRKEKEKMQAEKVKGEHESQGLLIPEFSFSGREFEEEEIAAQKEKTVVQFKEMYQLLEKQEKDLLSQMEEVEKEITETRDGHVTKILEDVSSLERSIVELEEKLQQRTDELVQDIRSILQRFEESKFENPPFFSPELKRRVRNFYDIDPFLEHLMKQLKGTKEMQSVGHGMTDRS
ncbi:Zinc finger protein RFP [Varanus komodoensis]|nr:Zinc finger protein RFP [Varanus komodoensis]